MSQLGTLADRILDAVHRAPGCQVDDLVLSATEFDCVVGCPRCHNLMVEETFVDRQVSPSVSSFTGWRCMSCGEILDPIILQNRTPHPEPQYGRGRRW
jgi:hypothetical protein